MDWIEKLNASIAYIENHLTETIDHEELASIACCSYYQFQRMFSYLTAVPLSEYIRRRKMSLAAAELMSQQAKVIEIALKYGYSSPTAFTRAFQSVHGIAPSMVKSNKQIIKAYPPLHIDMNVQGNCELSYRLEEREEQQVIGVSMELTEELQDNLRRIPLFWNRMLQAGVIDEIHRRKEDANAEIIGVNLCGSEKPWRYVIAVEGSAADGLESYTIPAMTWAVFEQHGTGLSIQSLEKRIYQEWLPTSGYKLGSAPDLERYYQPNSETMRYEVWVPIQLGGKQ